jgi:hypothetical protein
MSDTPATQPTPATHWLVPKPVWNEDNECLIGQGTIGAVWMTHGGAFFGHLYGREKQQMTIKSSRFEARAWVEA